MEFLFDSANLEAIRTYSQCFPITGVTSNPSIIKAEGKIDFYKHFKAIREVIGFDKTLHIQVLAETCEEILKEAELILQNVDDKVFIKIPTTEEGLKAMRALKDKGVGVTATAIYSKIQGFMAIAAGADYIAPYFNRMENLDIDPRDVIAAFAEMIARTGSHTKILAASFKNVAQVNDAFLAGAHTATVQPSLLHDAFSMAAIKKAVDDFSRDWKDTFGDVSFADLVK